MEDTIKRTPSLTLDGTTTSQTVLLEDGRWGTTDLIFPTSSSLVVTVTVSGETHAFDTNPTDFVNTVVNTPTATSYAAGVSITVAAGAVLTVSTLNKSAIKVSRVSGSGTLVVSSSPLPSSPGQAGANATIQATSINEDSAATDLELLVKTGEVRRDTPVTSAGTSGDWATPNQDANGAHWVSSATLLAGENLTTNRMMVEHSYSYSGVKVADALIKSGAGFVHAIQIAQADAAPTAGTIQIRDATSAGTGTVIWEWNLTTAVFVPFSIILDCDFATGLYFDFTTTGDVNVTGSYR